MSHLVNVINCFIGKRGAAAAASKIILAAANQRFNYIPDFAELNIMIDRIRIMRMHSIYIEYASSFSIVV